MIQAILLSLALFLGVVWLLEWRDDRKKRKK